MRTECFYNVTFALFPGLGRAGSEKEDFLITTMVGMLAISYFTIFDYKYNSHTVSPQNINVVCLISAVLMRFMIIIVIGNVVVIILSISSS